MKTRTENAARITAEFGSPQNQLVGEIRRVKFAGDFRRQDFEAAVKATGAYFEAESGNRRRGFNYTVRGYNTGEIADIARMFGVIEITIPAY